MNLRIAICFILIILGNASYAEDQSKKTAINIANPLAAMISVPMQLNYDNSTYVEPWLSYITKNNTTISISSETSYDAHISKQWIVPVIFKVDHLLEFNKRYIQLGGALKYGVNAPPGASKGLGARLQLTFLFEK